MRRRKYLIVAGFIPVLSLGLTLGLLCLLNGALSSHAAPVELPASELRVCPGGCDYSSVQAAVDAAHDGDVIKIAAGVYTGVYARDGVTQVVYISKSITLQGGYTSTNWDMSNPISYPTTLDAQGQGRVIFIRGGINPTIEGLRITGGDAKGLWGYGNPWRREMHAGGGIYIIDATAIISNNWIFSNTAGIGGGLHLRYNDTMLISNTVTANTAGIGGGIALDDSDATLNGNIVFSNTAGDGGGLELGWYSGATLNGNTVYSNTADNGGGLHLWWHSNATLNGNTVTANTANNGGGLWLEGSGATLNGNIVSSNTADNGGGLYLWYSDAVLDNNFVTDNDSSSGHGSGLYMHASSPQLRHNTIARNHGGGGEGLYVAGAEQSSQPQLHNTILVSHELGVCAMAGNTVTLEATLWGNDTDWDCDGTVITGSINVWGDPAFVNPDAKDYHIGSNSAAVDAGACPSLDDDFDGDPRPTAFGPDIGADERPDPGLQLQKRALLRFPLSARNPGQTITYTLIVTGVGTRMVDNVVLTDTLPPEQRVVASVANTGDCALATTPLWGGQVACTLGTLGVGDSARATLTARITTTIPSTLPRRMRNRVQVAGAQASNNCAYADVYMHDCHVRLNDGLSEWDDIQTAVDASTRPTDVVKVAGFCAGINSLGDTSQVVYISKTMTIRGGYSYSLAIWNTPDPAANPTTLDAWRQGRVLYITGDISPTVEGLRIANGDADGLGGYVHWAWGPIDVGGGIYILDATAIISNNQIFSNTAGWGGGMYLGWYSEAMLSGNTVTANTASLGGGLCLNDSNATLDGNTVAANTADGGGGLFLRYSDAALSGNTVTANNGSGLFLSNSAATLTGNTVSSNTADSGGGLFLSGSAATLSDNNIIANAAANGGGGLHLEWRSDATLNGNTIAANTAGYGGGLYLNGSDTTLSGNIVTANIAHTVGGGLSLEGSKATLNDNTIFSNIAHNGGGGLYLWESDAALSGNAIIANTAGSGGGLRLDASRATLSGNTVLSNTVANDGGGLYLDGSAATLSGNTISSNTAVWIGGGLYLWYSDATLSGNTVTGNTAYGGGGLGLYFSNPTLTNNVVADNQVNTVGSGLYVAGSSPHLLHTTIARNSGGEGSGLHATNAYMNETHYSSVVLTNTILVSQTVGITVTAGNTATLEATLWGTSTWANGFDWGGAGKIVTSSVNVWGAPAFVNPDAGDYHIRVGSAARDAGVNAGVSTDIDGQRRPHSAGYDIGADEWGTSTIYLPLTLQSWPPVPDLYPIVNTDGDGNYEVCWSAIDLASYYVLEEATNSDFINDRQIYSDTDTCYSISDQGAARYYYRVKARNGWPDNVWSKVQSVDVLWEAEPNDDALTQANGPIVSGLTYYGAFPSKLDVKDYFSFTLSTSHSVELWLTNIAPGHDYDLVLRDSKLILVGFSGNLGNANEHILIPSLSPDRYFIQVYNASQSGSLQPYHLQVVYQ